MLTVEQVEAKVVDIDELVSDPEAAHAREDALYVEVLEAIAAGSPQAVELAKAALMTQNTDHERWCA